MTSIEWLWEQIDGIIPYQDIKTSQLFNGVLEQAKEMHKQEIIDAYKRESAYMKYIGCSDEQIKTSAKKYYQETFVSKGSDDTLKDYHIVDTNEMVQFPKQELSDEEIDEGALKFIKSLNDSDVEKGMINNDVKNKLEGFFYGVKWYREELKLKQPKKD